MIGPTRTIFLEQLGHTYLSYLSASEAETILTLVEEYDIELFHELKSVRLEIAKSKKVAPYMILHDKTLIEMARKKPLEISDLHHISGMGHAKIEQYGFPFLNAIKIFTEQI